MCVMFSIPVPYAAVEQIVKAHVLLVLSYKSRLVSYCYCYLILFYSILFYSILFYSLF